MRLIIVILIVASVSGLLSHVNKFPNINEPMAELICIQEGIAHVSVD